MIRILAALLTIAGLSASAAQAKAQTINIHRLMEANCTPYARLIGLSEVYLPAPEVITVGRVSYAPTHIARLFPSAENNRYLLLNFAPFQDEGAKAYAAFDAACSGACVAALKLAPHEFEADEMLRTGALYGEFETVCSRPEASSPILPFGVTYGPAAEYRVLQAIFLAPTARLEQMRGVEPDIAGAALLDVGRDAVEQLKAAAE